MTGPFEGTDRITVTGVEVFAHHGVLQSERDYGQTFIIDFTVSTDVAAAGHTDDLAHTLNYAELTNQVVAAVKTAPVNLIETLAERVATALLEHPLARAVEVTIHKPEAPLEHPFTDVSVTVVRRRA